MGRNRTVSSSAIARAVSDAAAGEYASAIETLVTAISLIKQSKVAADDRCKILISSLQDTLRGVETKSYGSARRGKIFHLHVISVVYFVVLILNVYICKGFKNYFCYTIEDSF